MVCFSKLVLAHKHKVKPGTKEYLLYDFIQAKLVYVIRNQHSCDYKLLGCSNRVS